MLMHMAYSSTFKSYQKSSISSVFTLDVDECITRPCINGGTCQNQYGSYSCVCKRGYTGKHCETSKLNLDDTL